MKILFVVPYPVGHSPSQRFRFEQYFKILEKAGHQYRVSSFYTEAGWKALYASDEVLAKIFGVAGGFVRRLGLMFSLNQYDIVFIHREVTPVGPPLFEWFIAKLAGKKVVYDFDDAIWLTDKDEVPLQKLIRWRSKVSSIIKWSYKVSCGNQYLSDYSKQFNNNVFCNPSTIDTSYHVPAKKQDTHVTIGWTGSHSTLKYLNNLVPVISILEKKYPGMKFRVIANHHPNYDLGSFEFIKWSQQTEIADLSVIDIGVMPLPDDNWSKGKCGFKLLQYMSLGIPCVASPVGVNTQLITDGVEGYLCQSADEWIIAIEKLIADASLRMTMGKAGRIKVEKNYSVVSNSSTFLSLFDR